MIAAETVFSMLLYCGSEKWTCVTLYKYLVTDFQEISLFNKFLLTIWSDIDLVTRSVRGQPHDDDDDLLYVTLKTSTGYRSWNAKRAWIAITVTKNFIVLSICPTKPS